jgi:putative CRISPR-associated protein (TIGR02619 family)
MRPHTIIATVGTSLLGNIRSLQAKLDKGGTLSASETDLLRFTTNKDWAQAARVLRSLQPNERLCGAEINSLYSLQQKQQIQDPPQILHFCISDTDDGRALGEILRGYYQGVRVEIHEIEGLQDADPNRFRVTGLRELAREIGNIVRSAGDASFVAINATGGYKAQIAIAILIGQTLAVAVHYKHELFNEIIEFPPMPISFDYELIGRNAALLNALESEDIIELDESKIDPSLRVLLEEVEAENGKKLWALAPIGQIYLDGFRQRHPPEITLPPPASSRNSPTYRDDHYPIGFREFVKKVWRENEFVSGCHSLPYDRQRSIRNRQFYVRESDGQIVGEYLDRKNFGARFGINTTAVDMAQKTAVVMFLNKKYGKSD